MHSDECRKRIWDLIQKDANNGNAWATRKVENEAERQARIDRRVAEEGQIYDEAVQRDEQRHEDDVEGMR